MKKWKVSDEVFPFLCEGSDCKKAYSHKEFSSTALKIGYIFLTNDEFNFIGLTCPACNKTTLKKLSLSESNLMNNATLHFKNFIPFLADGLPELNKDDTKDRYHVPDAFQSLSQSHQYPQWFEEECIYNICESDFDKIITYENKNHKKIFPRIIGIFSIYNTTEKFIYFLKNKKISLDDIDDTGVDVVALNEIIMNIAKSNYLAGAESNITESEYKDLCIPFTLPSDYGNSFIENMPSLLNEYIKIRSDFDYYLSYKTKYLDKYIKQFYYVKGYHGSKQYSEDKVLYEEILGKQFKHGIPRIDESDDQEVLSHAEILQRWNKHISVLKLFVMNKDLPAYYFTGAYFDPSKPQTPNNDFNPENYVYLKSEVKDLELLKPWLFKDINKDEETDSEPLNAKEKRELGQLRTEKLKWDASISAAVQIGMFVVNADKPITRKTIETKLYEIDKDLQTTVFEKIWKAIPSEFRSQGGRPRTEKTEE